MAARAVPRVGDVGPDGFNVRGKLIAARRQGNVEELEALDRLVVEGTLGEQVRRELAPDHPSRASDQDVHGSELF